MKASAIVARVAAGLAAATASVSAWADSEPVRWQLNMPEGVTRTAHNAYDMHMLMLWICVVIGIVVFGAMGYAMFKFRKSKGAKPDVDFTHSTKLEIIWTVVPVLILVIMAVPATSKVMEQYTAKGHEMTVKVTGYQWMWRYEIVGEDVNFISRLDRESDRIRQSGETPDEAAHPHYLRDVDRDPRYRFVRGDVADPSAWSAHVGGAVDYVVHFAAETHVDRSIQDPYPFLRTNVEGTQRMLDFARASGVRRFVQGFPSAVDVFFVAARQAADRGAAHGAGDLADRFEVARRGDWEAGLDHVDAQIHQRLGDLELLFEVHAAAGRLLAVAERCVEYHDLSGGGSGGHGGGKG